MPEPDVALSTFFHLPINKAAKELGICPTLLKKKCRQQNINRWPYRKISSIDMLIKEVNKSLDGNEHPDSLLSVLAFLKEKRLLLLENPNVTYQSVISKYYINSFRHKLKQFETAPPSSMTKSSISRPITKRSKKKKDQTPGSPLQIPPTPTNTPTRASTTLENDVAALALIELASLENEIKNILPYQRKTITTEEINFPSSLLSPHIFGEHTYSSIMSIPLISPMDNPLRKSSELLIRISC